MRIDILKGNIMVQLVFQFMFIDKKLHRKQVCFIYETSDIKYGQKALLKHNNL